MEILKNQYDMEGSGLIVIYGRRRVGKTELINNFMSGHGLYFLATNEGDTENIRNFQKLLSEFLNDKSIEYAYYNDWYSLFSSIAIIIFDFFVFSIKFLLLTMDEKSEYQSL